MLYITTRNDQETYTSHRALEGSRSPDGGMYLPFHQPKFTGEELEQMLCQSANSCIAQVLNRLFSSELTGWDLDFSMGRRPVALHALGHRITVGEIWHNSQGNYEHLVRELTARLLGTWEQTPGDWPRIAVNTAVIFALFGERRKAGWTDPADVAVVAGDFSWPVSVWYARQWGLNVGQIICCCNENNSLWELFHQGQLRTDGVSVPTGIPMADVALPAGLERLIYHCAGTEETERYLDACRRGKPYCPDDAVLEKMRRGISVHVVSSTRVGSMIRNVSNTYGYRLSADAALAYGGVMDHRAKGGQYRPCLILSGENPKGNTV